MRQAGIFNRAGAVILAALLFIALNIIATHLLTSARLDLTEDRLYTLSDGTRQILAEMKEPVTLRFFYSEKLAASYPSLSSYGRRVRDLLETYAGLANGKIDLRIIDPEPFSPAEDDAVAAGLRAMQTPTGETVYFGLVGSNSVDAQIAIPFLSAEREEFLEYDVSKLVADLQASKKPLVGLISSLPLEFGPGGAMAAAQGQSAPYFIYEQLRQSYDVRSLGHVFAKLPDGLDLVIIAHPMELGDAELYAIDQFVLQGGKAIVFVDPNLESAAYLGQGPTGGVPASSSLPKLLDAWGVAYDDGKVVADRALAQRVSMMDAGGGRVIKDYVAWIAPKAGHFATEDIVTADLNTLNLASAGAIKAKDGATTRLEPLLTSSTESMLIDAVDVRYGPDPDELLRNFAADGTEKIIAARISGPASSAFAAAPEGSEITAAHIGQSPNINVLVMADADFLEDRFWVNVQNFLGQRIAVPMADNGALVVNAVDNMVGASALISLRSRGVSQRPFTVVEDIRKRAEAEFLEEEKRLEAKLQETESRLRELEEGRAGGDAAALNQSQAAEVEAFRQEMLSTRRQLRDVQHNLRKDIEQLGAAVKFVNIAAVPLLVTLAGLTVAALRRRRRAAARRQAGA